MYPHGLIPAFVRVIVSVCRMISLFFNKESLLLYRNSSRHLATSTPVRKVGHPYNIDTTMYLPFIILIQLYTHSYDNDSIIIIIII